MTATYKTATIFIGRSNPLFAVIDEYAFLCKNLKNSILYVFRQAFFEKKDTPSAYKLIKKFTQDNQQDYVAMPRKVSQQLFLQVAREFKSFWALFMAWLGNKEELPKPSLPGYLHKTKGRANVIFTNQAVSIKDLTKGILTLSTFDKSRPISVKLGNLANIINKDNLQEVKLVRNGDGYDVNITYKDKQQNTPSDEQPMPKRVLSVDFGINNLMTVASNCGLQSALIKGKALKSFNQYFNKQRARLQSRLDTANEYQKPGIQRKLNRLYRKRKHKLKDYLHKASRCLINHAVSNNIDTIVIGYNQGWKQEIELGSVNNQKFASIPFLRLVELIQHKAQEAGIYVVITEESYTSKCSFIDNEPLQKQEVYLGKRIKRGLFRTATGKLINADVNGALNILRKVIGDFKFDLIQVCSTPKTINVLK